MDLSLLVSGIVLFLAQLLFVKKVIQALWRSPDLPIIICKELLQYFRRFKVLAISLCGLVGGNGDGGDLMSREVSKLYDERRVQIATYVVWVCWIAGVVRGIETVPRAVAQTPYLEAEGPLRLTQALLMFMATLAVSFPKVFLNMSGLCVMHLIGMLLLCIGVSPLVSPDGVVLYQYRGELMMLTSCISMVFLNFATNIITNTVVLVCFLLGYASTNNEVESLTVDGMVRQEMYTYIWKVVVLYCCGAALKYSTRREVEAKLGKCQLSAVMALLDMLCDVVVDLDSNLILKEHSVKFAGVLMRRTEKSLQGAAFTDFIIDGEDQTRFLDTVLAKSVQEDAPPTSGMISAHFRDSMGSRVKFVVFHVPYRDISGTLNYLIGLREDVDMLTMPKPSDDVLPTSSIGMLGSDFGQQESGVWSGGSSGGTSGRIPPAGVLRPDLAARLSSPNNGGSSRRRGASGTRSSGSGSSALTKAYDLEIEVDLEQGLPISKTQTGKAATLVLEGEGPVFKDLIQGGGEDFISWVLGKREEVRSGVLAPSVVSFGNLSIVGDTSGSSDAACPCLVDVDFGIPAVPGTPGNAGDDSKGKRAKIMVHRIRTSRHKRNSAATRGTRARVDAQALGRSCMSEESDPHLMLL